MREGKVLKRENYLIDGTFFKMWIKIQKYIREVINFINFLVNILL